MYSRLGVTQRGKVNAAKTGRARESDSHVFGDVRRWIAVLTWRTPRGLRLI